MTAQMFWGFGDPQFPVSVHMSPFHISRFKSIPTSGLILTKRPYGVNRAINSSMTLIYRFFEEKMSFQTDTFFKKNSHSS